MGKAKDLHRASVSVVKMLHKAGYIHDRRKEELLYSIKTGDRAVYSELQVLLLVMAEEIGRL